MGLILRMGHFDRSHFDKGLFINDVTQILSFHRTLWSCGLIHHVLNREVGGSNLGTAFYSFGDDWKKDSTMEKRKMKRAYVVDWLREKGHTLAK